MVDFDGKTFVKSAETRMRKSVESLKSNLQTLRTGRATPDLLARVTVEYYGAETPLTQLASVSVQGSQLVVSPYDKSALQDMDAALLEANLGMVPSNDGEVIRLTVPQLTEERRKEIMKKAKQIGEEAKVAVRNIRRSANDDVKKQSKELGEDTTRATTDDIQKTTDKIIKEIEAVVATKEKDIMKV
ncbi:hypothetical protein CTAYLR_009082 [Chrysophaeum taylorii]|uniref:Ribosome recycling factor domain-containing protein n=1 Tax=Chrysophaeum taylorii TaxID=2483200 RepID=A0AAD7XNI6_9STRA|nr:hypothetical protein CTAYLR_009082 [Chrysophaeum taylorii]